MFSEEDRLASFATTSSTTTSTANKRQSTKTAAASSSTLQWPHPVSGRSAKSSGIPTPPLLAKNGFYYAPTQDAPDMVSHFLYPDVQIANWQPSDNPLLRLEEALPGNGWCRIFRSEQQALFDEASGKWTWQVSDLLPTSKEMVQARKETFGSLWPYDGKKGWKPTSKKLAEAGFFFTPTEEEPDNATCIYCGKALGGWEKADDPVHEHQRRHPECALFNCELREAPQQEAESTQKPMVEDRSATANADGAEEIASKKGGKRAVSSATRKASHKVSKAKSSTLAVSDEGQTPAEHDNTSATKSEVATIQDPAENIGTEEPKGARKTRSVSTRKTAAKSQIAEAIAEPVDADAETEPPAAEAQEPVKTLKTKKSAVGLGNGNRVAATARPSRAASRRATKAIGLLSADDDVDRIPRRPDKEDLERRELALSDPIPFPTVQNEDQPEPATDPITSAKPKRSRSKTQKLAQAATPKEPTPEPEPVVEAEVEVEEDAVPLRDADNTVIEHDASEAEAEEEPKRRGRGGSKTSSAKAPTTVSIAGPRSRKAASKTAAPPAFSEPEEEAVEEAAVEATQIVFPSMSSEANDEPIQPRSGRSVSSNASTTAKKSGSIVTASSRAGSRNASSSAAKRASAKSTASVSDIETASSDSVEAVREPETDPASGTLPNTGSQATIRGARRDSSDSIASSPPPPSQSRRVALAQLSQLSTLQLDESQRAMTLGEWLQMKAEAAAQEMREAGEAQLADLENQLRDGRMAIERQLRGRA